MTDSLLNTKNANHGVIINSIISEIIYSDVVITQSVNMGTVSNGALPMELNFGLPPALPLYVITVVMSVLSTELLFFFYIFIYIRIYMYEHFHGRVSISYCFYR